MVRQTQKPTPLCQLLHCRRHQRTLIRNFATEESVDRNHWTSCAVFVGHRDRSSVHAPPWRGYRNESALRPFGKRTLDAMLHWSLHMYGCRLIEASYPLNPSKKVAGWNVYDTSHSTAPCRHLTLAVSLFTLLPVRVVISSNSPEYMIHHTCGKSVPT